MAAIDIVAVIDALISGLGGLKTAMAPESAAPTTVKPPVSTPAAGATIALSAFLAAPVAMQTQLIAEGVRIVPG